MKRVRGVAAIAFALGTAALSAHDLFIRPEAFFVAANAQVVVPVFNGTFSTSENAVARDRLSDVSLVGPFGRRTVSTDRWTEVDPRSTVTVQTEGEGTYVIGAAIKPRLLSLSGTEFNAYLKEEGIDQILRDRRASRILDEPSRERYAKFPKALIQVGTETGRAYATELGYEAEIVPLINPYTLGVGDTLPVRCTVLGKPLPDYVVLAGGRSEDGTSRLPVQRLTTDATGITRVKLSAAGAWYVKFVHMQAVTAPDANYESRWATLTFGVRARRR